MTNSWLSSHCILLGAHGFVGERFAQKMRQSGVNVVAPSSREINLVDPASADTLASLFSVDTPLVCCSRSQKPLRDPDTFREELAMATTIARALSTRRLRSVIYLSSFSVYGEAPQDTTVSENTLAVPTSAYAKGKLAGEELLAQACRKEGVPLSILRICKIYGPGDPSGNYGPASFFASLQRNEPFKVYGDGAELRDHVYISDVVQVVREAATGKCEGIFNVASGEAHSFMDIIGMISKVIGRQAHIEHLERSGPRINIRTDIRKLREALPSLRMTTMEEGIRETFQFLSLER